ncbi:MAG: penicillin-binding protein 2 [Candidatus Wildermuthbacteria bacterium RIFCSPHIGHO2_02_FULL_49_9]|uniref:Penicillin-binding protein 2 n=1 Tax=Candidatus Wildermuthbacteria bacterium RIFCSPHIGHO2_02_FULL_49_9 TaxID=1802456 RepID=A0A1G2RE24_9BACT|nr:MAG: penicillin-binding protein 2 [Candidatus Wildermuthbacteria bacterium RIFCSPHIGHO2_02_FULL_49_9]
MFGSRDIYKKKLAGEEIEIQEVLLDNLARKKEGDEFAEQRIELPLSETVLRLLYGSFVLVAAVILIKSFDLQVLAAQEMREAAKYNALRAIPLASDRGVLYDSSFLQLAFNKPSFGFVCDNFNMPSTPKEKEDLLRRASALLGISFAELKDEVQKNVASRLLVKENLSHEELVLLQAKTSEFEGCLVQENVRREYIEGELFSHILGYTARVSAQEFAELEEYSITDQIGKTGVEKAYEELLRGNPGRIVLERGADGKIVGEKETIASKQGISLVLWLDAGLQERIAESLKETFGNTGTKAGAAVALNPLTGGILSLVSLPSFDANLFAEGINSKEWNSLITNPSKPLFNRALSGVGYPTGSIIKPLIGVAALEEGVIKEETKIFAPLELCVENIYTKEDECFRDWTFHGWSDIKRAIAESVNTFFYIIGGGKEGFLGLGPGKIKEYVERFGWGEKTGVDLPGEGEGILPVFDENWRLGDTYHLSIGQGPFAVTPLQVASAFAAVANGGMLYEPQAVKAFVDGERNTQEVIKPKLKKEVFVDKQTLEVIKEGMRQTVTAGSATGWLDSLPVKAAAKTGTAQTGKKTYDGKDYLYSWTVVFAPLENPEIVLVVVVEDVQEGQVAALPVARDALQWYFSR